MPTILDLLVLERDLAVFLSCVETEDEAIGAVLDAVVSCDPESGAAVSVSRGMREEAASRGTLGDEARLLVLGAIIQSDVEQFRLVLELADSRGRFGRFAFVGSGPSQRFPPLAETFERAAKMLSSAIGRIVTARDLDAAAKDQEFLVREMRHRTRNSLQLIKGSIGLFVGTLASTPPEILEAIDERLGALVIVHEMLSWTESSDLVSAETYFAQLAESLRRIAPEGVGTLIAYYDAAEDVFLPVDRAATMGLIVHELVINTAKHSGGRLQRMSVRIDFSDGLLYLRYGETPVRLPFASRLPISESADPSRSKAAGRGLAIIEALVVRARGRRLDDGSDMARFAAAFPLD
ncbi:MAG: sensor histidine kinase [Treponemataceae bacterium]